MHTLSLLFHKKPTVRGSGSAFLRILEFETQKFLKLIKIRVFSFLKISCFEPPIFLNFEAKILAGQLFVNFGQKIGHLVQMLIFLLKLLHIGLSA